MKLIIIFLSFFITYVHTEKVRVYLDKGDNLIVKHNEKYPSDVFGILVAESSFNDNINTTGWSVLEIVTSPQANDSLQAYSAGYAEAVLTLNRIQSHSKNVVGNYCKESSIYCTNLMKFFDQNLQFMKKQITRHRANNPYWHHVALVLEQLKGLSDGYKGTKSGPSIDVSTSDIFYYLNNLGDLEDLEIALSKPESLKSIGIGSCSALVKLLPDKSDLFTSQVTWNTFNSMTRVLKNYKLSYHFLPGGSSELVPGNQATFSSYPGTLQSGDDFYVLSSGLTTLETTIGNNNNDLYRHIKPKGVVLEWIRSIVSNRLAHNGKEWAHYFKQFNSGTYNNQWIVVDYKLFEPFKPLKNGLLTIVEQVPTLIMNNDLTHLVKKQGYFPSFNQPFFDQVCNISLCSPNGKNDYDKSPRAQIFRRDQKNVVDLPSMIKLMRYNDYLHDPLSKCDCNPPANGELAISARSDLNPKNGTYPAAYLKHRNHGATDMKVTSFTLQKTLQFTAISSPPYDNVPAFQWSKSDFDDASSVGLPDKWTFGPVTQKWDYN